MLESLLIKSDSRDILMETDDLLPVLDEQLIPGIDLGGLVDEHLLQIGVGAAAGAPPKEKLEPVAAVVVVAAGVDPKLNPVELQ